MGGLIISKTGLKGPGGMSGKFWRSVNKVVDPLNIMDPMGILPTSMIAGKKPFTLDKNYGKLQWNLGGGSSSYTPMTKGLSSNPEYFAQQQQMLGNMRQQQQAKLANLRTQGEIYPTATTAPAQVSQSPQATTTAPATTALAQSQVGDTTALSSMPAEYIYKPATATTKSVAANTFQMPDMSNIKFGGV
jgi:hypothetical protein